MLKRIFLYILVMIILLGVAITAGQWDKDTTLLVQNADEIGSFLLSRESEGLAWAHQHSSEMEQASAGKPPSRTTDFWQEQANKDYTVFVYRGDSILFWSNNKYLPVRSGLALLKGLTGRKLLQLPPGDFLATQENTGAGQLTVLVPIRYNLDARLTGAFPAGKNISGKILVVNKTTPFPVTLQGKELCWLATDGSVESVWLQWVQLLFYGLFLIVFLVLASQGANWISNRYGTMAGVSLPVIIVLLLMKFLPEFTGSQFNALHLFADRFESPSLIGGSLGAWLLNIGLLVWLMLLFHRMFRSEKVDQAPGSLRALLAGFSYLLAMGSVWFSTEILHQLIIHSRINFDFDNLLNLTGNSIAAIGGVLMLMTGLFVFNHRMMLTVRDAGLDLRTRAGMMAAAGLVFGILCALLAGPQINLFQLLVFAVLYTAVFDAYVHWETPGFGWIICWLLLFSLFASAALSRFNNLKKRSDRMEYAAALVVERDTAYAEKLLPGTYNILKADSAQVNVLLKPWPFKANASEVRDHFNALVFGQHYLFQHYRLNVYAFDRENQPMLLGQTADYNFVVQDNWNKGLPLPNALSVRYLADQEGKFRYMMQFNAFRMGDLNHPARVFCFFEHEFPKPSKVYAQLFFNTPYKNLPLLKEYDFAIRRNGKLVVEQGQDNPVLLNTPLQQGEGKEVETAEPNNRVDAVFKSADGSSVAEIGRRKGSWLREIYLFALLFTVGSLFLSLMALANTYLHFLPDYLQLRLQAKGSLAKRIHFSNITLIGVAFFVTGLITYQHFTEASLESEVTNLDFRAESVLTNLKMQLVNSSLSADSLRRTLPKSLSVISASLKMDANLYAPSGALAYTTQEDLAGLGVVAPYMNPSAWETLKNGTASEQVSPEQTAGFEYFTKYLPLRSNQNQLLGFLGVPYQLSTHKPGPEVSDFIGILASLYAFLLLIAYAVTFLLARSIIRPVALISEKIKELRLEDKNVPLEYKGDSEDELSELIAQYNRMVDKLEDSKVQMIRLERESAWKEMARQVAHDIKNPLTTMKLSMQQLERVSSDPEQAAAYLRKAITRLIEQIDSLAQIASEFSMFANLDIRAKSDMVLNEVVESVHDLFSEQKNVDLDLKMPNDEMHIMGDKNHLIRVFNNLVINAMQAIPSDRRGQIHVSLTRENKYAIVRISDNGGGIPTEIRQRVFEPNFTTKTSGSGLGLAICKKIIEAHDGNIRFETRENEGTDFYVELPVMKLERKN
jgi:signal transduction histidine kinase